MKKLIPPMVALAAIAIAGGYLALEGAGDETIKKKQSPAQNNMATSSNSNHVIQNNSQVNATKQTAKNSAAKVANPADLIIRMNKDSNTPSFISAPDGQVLSARNPSLSNQENAQQFFSANAGLFQTDKAGTELAFQKENTDMLGMKNLTFQQEYNGVEVFGAQTKAHFSKEGNLVSVNGKTLPNIEVDTSPTVSMDKAQAQATLFVNTAKNSDAKPVNGNLVIYNQGFVKHGSPTSNNLAWNVEVSNGGNVREFVFVDAHNGKVLDTITGVYNNMSRVAYDAQYQPAPGPNFPANPFWVEGNVFPTTLNNPFCVQGSGLPLCNDDANAMIQGQKETYDFFFKTFGRDSIDGSGLPIRGVFSRGDGCPNAGWSGGFAAFCPGYMSDDVVGHEFAHGYTEYTAGLLYAYQSGALNESFSDIWGDVVDLINGRGSDIPNTTRTTNGCSTLTNIIQPAELVVNSPSTIANSYAAQPAAFGPAITSVTTGNVSTTTPANGCDVISEDLTGKIALMDRGTCNFTVKTLNAQLKGAIGVIIADNTADSIPGMGGSNPSITIPALGITQATGNLIKSAMTNSVVNVSFSPLGSALVATDNSYRWLHGEDGITGGTNRDMWNPQCKNHPGKVSDLNYYCYAGDSGGVHSNSGIPNHAFALLTDGGNYNGQSITGIGLLKAVYIHFRALETYLHSISGFSEHADALEASCRDLIGVPLTGFDGSPSGQSINATDCEQVTKTIAAVEFRGEPRCNYQPLLAKNPPPLCSTGKVSASLFSDGFEAGKSSSVRWTISVSDQTPDFNLNQWQLVSSLPGNRMGHAFFAEDPQAGTCGPGGDISSVRHLDSPVIQVPSSVTDPKLTFEHYVAVEPFYDGGNLKIRVNGGPWQLIEAKDFVYNPYNGVLLPATASSNPMAGQPAFTGSDQGKATGSWGRSIVNLAPYAPPGSTIQLRFDLGIDGCSGYFGWFVDDVSVYTCRSK